MPTLFCCILNCETDSGTSKKRKIFYRLPQNVDRKQLWLGQISDRVKYATVSSNSRICNAHFATGKPNLDSSHVDYVPNIFPWSSKDDRERSYRAVEHYETKIKELEQKILAKAFLNASSESKVQPETVLTKLETGDYRRDIERPNIKLEPSVTKIHHSISHPVVTLTERPAMDIGNTVALNSGFINYLISSLTQVNVPHKADVLGTTPLSVNVTLPSCPLNLSQSCNKQDERSLTSLSPEQSTEAVFHQTQSNIVIASVHGLTSADDGNARSCTCTKSSCLKLYCECFATGNLCSSGCTCNNCRNNNNHREERTKIVNSYLERDPWVFNSKIARYVGHKIVYSHVSDQEIKDSQDISKKHSKGCNCLKSSCLKNYCECFENKVFCSSLCRCRMCYNNEDHTHQSHHREDTKIYTASHTSDSLSVVSENSPKDFRKRRKSAVKSNDMYEDVSSNESGCELGVKRQQLDSATASIDNDMLSGRSITSMDIPPVLPQEDDFTEEELALMLRFREQRSVKVESVSPPLSQCTPMNLMHAARLNYPTMSPVLSVPTQIDPSLLLSLSQSLTVAELGLGTLNPSVNHRAPQEACTLTDSDLMNLLVTQQLVVSRQSSLAPNYGHVLPVHLAPQIPTQTHCPPQSNGYCTTVPTSSRPVCTTAQASANCSQSKTKLSTEDYVRRHIEAAERAVRADNMRRDCVGSKKAIARQKTKLETTTSPPHKISPSSVACVKQEETHPPSTSTLAKPQIEDCPATNGGHLSNGHSSEMSSCSAASYATNTSPQCTEVCSGALAGLVLNGTPKAAPHSPQFDRKWKQKHDRLRQSLHGMRTELRSIKVHLRADQAKIRRLERTLLYMSNELHD